jgi:hypothetical protein
LILRVFGRCLKASVYDDQLRSQKKILGGGGSVTSTADFSTSNLEDVPLSDDDDRPAPDSEPEQPMLLDVPRVVTDLGL